MGVITRDGTPGYKYRTAHKQHERLLTKVIRVERLEKEDGCDLNWLETRLIRGSILPEFFETVAAIAVDETAYEAWQVQQVWDTQEDINRNTRAAFRERNPNADIPEMSSPVMRAIAAELGTPIGEDGRSERTPLNPDVRSGYRTPTRKQPNPKYIGSAVHFVHAVRDFIWQRNQDTVTDGDDILPLILAVTTRPANTNPAPGGDRTNRQSAGHMPQRQALPRRSGLHTQDPEFVAHLRRMGIEPHMGLPSDTTDKPYTRRFEQRGDGKFTAVKEFCGCFYHRFTPDYVFNLPYEERKPWMYTPNGKGDAPGSLRFMCPFKRGLIYNRRFATFKNAQPGAEPVDVPDDATSCCDGPCSFEAPAEQLTRYQTPHYGSNAHEEIKGYRNPAEGGFGTVKGAGGFDPKKCRVPLLESHALSAAHFAVAYNVQLVLNREFEEVREHQQAAKKAKQARRSEEATRKKKQNPKGLPHIVEPDSRDGADDEDDPSEGRGGR